MQLKLEFTLTFENDWHINAGFGADGKADAVLERDPYGKPIIGGATIKGIFRDALHDLALNLGKDPHEATDILGVAGRDSHWHFDAALPQIEGIRESIVATGVRVDPRYRRAEDNKYFVRELGAVEVFTFSVIGKVANDQALDEVEWLVVAAAYIERLGGRRRRGTGRCSIALSNDALHQTVLDSFATHYCGEKHHIKPEDILARLQLSLEAPQIVSFQNPSHRYRIILYTERPVIIAEKPEAGNVYQGQIIIPGSTLRGAFAELSHPNELKGDDYEQFKQLFVLGRLKFSHLSPLEVNAGIGIPVAQLPMGLQQVEASEDAFTSVFQQLSEQKAFSRWVLLQDDMQRVSYTTESHPHVGINPYLKRASDGNLYTYEAIPAGRYYIGEIYLEDENWQSIGNLLQVNVEQAFDLRIGKGRNRSYGKCKVVILPIIDAAESPTWIHVPLEQRLKATASNELYITLATDTILQDLWGRFYGRFEESWLADIFGIQEKEISIASRAAETNAAKTNGEEGDPAQVVRTKLIESFNTRSGLPRWRDKALVSGSTARLVFTSGKRPSIEVLQQLESQGIGLRRGEGYGRVIFNHPAHTYQWNHFSEGVAIPNDMVMPKRKSTSQERFVQLWSKILKDLRTDNKCKDLWTAKYETAAQSIARHLMQTLSQPPEQVLAGLNKSFSETPADKDSLKRYQEVAKFAHDQLHAVFIERRNHWRKAVILFAEALINNREKPDAQQ